MTVKVIIKRKVPEEAASFLEPLLNDLRSKARQQEGYITGETLDRIDKPGHSLVISTWRSMEDWRRWFASQERFDIQNKVDSLLGKFTEYEIYISKK
jgi:heme-degrading monooxygenase HmoA